MQWTDRIRQVKILLVVAAAVIAVASLLISHFLVRDLSNEERNKMEVWAQALHALNNADETTDVTLILDVMQGNNTIPVIVVNAEGGIDDFRNIDGIDENSPLSAINSRPPYAAGRRHHPSGLPDCLLR